MERDTSEELQKAIEKHLKDAEFRMVSLSVLKGERLNFKKAIYEDYFEAWILVEDYALAGFE